MKNLIRIFFVALVLTAGSCHSQHETDDDLDFQRQEEFDRGDFYEKRNMETPAQDHPLELDRDVFEIDDFKQDD